MPTPVIDKNKCTLCGTCTEVCPVGTLEKTDSEIKIEEGCIGCRACEAQCPENCLKIED